MKVLWWIPIIPQILSRVDIVLAVISGNTYGSLHSQIKLCIMSRDPDEGIVMDTRYTRNILYSWCRIDHHISLLIFILAFRNQIEGSLLGIRRRLRDGHSKNQLYHIVTMSCLPSCRLTRWGSLCNQEIHNPCTISIRQKMRTGCTLFTCLSM